MGAFLPFDRGLTSIQQGVPQPIQVAFFGSLFYYIAAYDPYLAGAYLRGIPFLGLENHENLQVTMVSFFLIMAFSSTLWNINLLTPLHDILYGITKVPFSPSAEEKVRRQQQSKENGVSGSGGNASSSSGDSLSAAFYSYSRLLIIGVSIVVSVYNALPRTSLAMGEVLPAGDYITSCTWWSQHTGKCKPYYLMVEPTGFLGLYRGASPKDSASEKIWTSKILKNPHKLPGDG